MDLNNTAQKVNGLTVHLSQKEKDLTNEEARHEIEAHPAIACRRVQP